MIDYNEIIKKGRSLLADMYGYGYAEGQKRVTEKAKDEETVENIYRKGFENGLEQAWECARKIVGCEIPWEAFDLRVGQSSDKAILKYSASEAIAKMKEYEQTDEMSMEEAIATLKYQYDNGQMEQDVHKALGMAIKSMEYIDDHAFTGHWIKKGNTLKCPFCGAKGENIKDDYCFNYCPNCGRRMVESQEREDEE